MFSKFKTLKKNDTKLDFPVCFFPLDNDFFSTLFIKIIHPRLIDSENQTIKSSLNNVLFSSMLFSVSLVSTITPFLTL